MAKYLHPDVLDGGPLVIKNSATKMLLIKAYAVGDSLATVTGNKVAEVAVVTGDFSLSTINTNDRRITGPAGKSAAASASSGAAPNLHIAFVDATRVLWVTDETTDQVVTAPNPVDFPQLNLDSPQPV
jgi:hypothetical protein